MGNTQTFKPIIKEYYNMEVNTIEEAKSFTK